MEKLQSLLTKYNQEHSEDLEFAPWGKQYCENPFPLYWQVVFNILNSLERKCRIVEIGCGLGDITAIPCYLGFTQIIAFEHNCLCAKSSKQRIANLFNRTDIVIESSFPIEKVQSADILILVNCVYPIDEKYKQKYKELLVSYYKAAGCPQYFIMEVIDSSYTEENEDFPFYLRLNKSDVESMFPQCKIYSWSTYVYPINQKSKTLYLIESI